MGLGVNSTGKCMSKTNHKNVCSSAESINKLICWQLKVKNLTSHSAQSKYILKIPATSGLVVKEHI